MTLLQNTQNNVFNHHTDTTGIKYGSLDLSTHLIWYQMFQIRTIVVNLIVNGEKKEEENGKVIIFDSTYTFKWYRCLQYITDKEQMYFIY